jgi:hypothetical protein
MVALLTGWRRTNGMDEIEKYAEFERTSALSCCF